MCAAMPARVVEKVSPERVLVEQGQIRREVNALLVPDIEVGDYVLLNLGVAVQRLTETEALAVLDLWQRISLSMAQPDSN
jgi:hydrogenase expression/formation protein HypC